MVDDMDREVNDTGCFISLINQIFELVLDDGYNFTPYALHIYDTIFISLIKP